MFKRRMKIRMMMRGIRSWTYVTEEIDDSPSVGLNGRGEIAGGLSPGRVRRLDDETKRFDCVATNSMIGQCRLDRKAELGADEGEDLGVGVLGGRLEVFGWVG